VPATTAAGTYTFTVTGRSIGQPTASGSTRTANFKVTVASDVSCVGCTFLPLYLHNVWPATCTAEPCDTTAKVDMPLRDDLPVAPSFGNFDTGIDDGPGRKVAWTAITPGATSTVSTTMANWRWLVPGKRTLKAGSVPVDLYVAVPGVGSAFGPNTGHVGVILYVNRITGTGATELLGTATAQLPSEATMGFRLLQVSVPIGTVSLTKNTHVEVKVVVDTLTTTGIWLAYDSVTYLSRVRLPLA
jgi:hypothetical protein